ncbi:MAG TPA: ATP-binding protein [Planctomycetota bacterium]|nr:ATP-binding protein [Planctomycetota bacterium]HRR80304.1 ATP-binding protein [Planctomycetota bacterium]HRT96130.1 ATP-binding protein [Planctomycetota bacterium]
MDRLPPVILHEFTMQDFKSFPEASLRIGLLTLLVGPNASGKSNLIEALRLLSWMARGQRLDRFNEAVERGELPLRGRAEDLPLDGKRQFGLAARFEYSDAHVLSSLDRFRVTVSVEGTGLRVQDESLKHLIQPNDFLYRVAAPATPPSHEIRVAYYGYTGLDNEPQALCQDHQLVLTQPAVFDPSYRSPTWVMSHLADCLSRIFFLDPAPNRMRGYVSRKADALHEDGSNVSGVLARVCADPVRREQVAAFIRSLPEREILGIEFDEAPPDEVRLRLAESFGADQRWRDARILSDGTMRVLAIGAALLSVPEWSILVIEEIDSGIHPSRVQELLANIRRCAERRNLGVLLTSHNPALLDALPHESLPHVTYCYRDPRTGGSRLQQLGERPELLAQGPVGRLVARGVLERVFRDTRDTEERRRDALAWVDTLGERQP